MSLFNIFNHPCYPLLFFPSSSYAATTVDDDIHRFVGDFPRKPLAEVLIHQAYVCNNLPHKADVYIHTFNLINFPAGQSRMFRIPSTHCAG